MKKLIALLLISILLLTSFKVEANLEKPNVVLIVINSWRADHISEVNTPTIYSILQDGVYFKNCVGSSPVTTVSDLSIMTGVYPYEHGIRNLGTNDFNKNITTIAEILKENDYKTAGFIGDFPLDSKYGFERGFDIYNDKFNFLDNLPLEFHNLKRALRFLGIIDAFEIKADKINKKINSWLNKGYEKPFFLFVHYFDPHMPYEPPKEYYNKDYDGKADGSWKYFHSIRDGKTELNKEDIKHMINLYDGEIRFVDESIKEILSKIDDKNTIIIIAGDHGEGLGDHNVYFDHGSNLYDEEIVVPLIIKYPKLSSKVIEKQVRSVDILPTILDLINVKKPEVDGISLIPIIEGGDLDLIAYSETSYVQTKVAIRTNKWKFILNEKSEELYDLKNDPKEKNNIVKEQKDIALQLKNKMFEISGEEKISSLFIKDNGIVKDINRKKLKALGYII